MKHAFSIEMIVLTALAVSSSVAKDGPAPAKNAIRAGKILTMKPGVEFIVGKGVINNGIILISNEKIEALGPASSIQIPEGYTVIDASDRWVTPGIVEAHTHIGTEGGFNDMVTPINPELKIADSVNPEDIGIEKGVTVGVTTINTMPGSGTNFAGISVIIKLDIFVSAGNIGDVYCLADISSRRSHSNSRRRPVHNHRWNC